MNLQLTIHENEPRQQDTSLVELDGAINEAAKEARRLETLNIIFIRVPNGNEVSLVVGGEQTAVGFTYGNQDPPYYVSKGPEETEEPVFTAFVSLSHHTEFPRKWVIPWTQGIQAVHEFVESGDLPAGIEWETL